MEKICKNFGVNLSKLKYPKHAVVIEGTKCLIVDRLNDSSPGTYSELYSFYLFGENLKEFWKNMKEFKQKFKRILGNI